MVKIYILPSSEKAAALGESLIINHPFIDGNKRTGAVAMIALLEENGLRLLANEEKSVQFYNFHFHWRKKI